MTTAKQFQILEDALDLRSMSEVTDDTNIDQNDMQAALDKAHDLEEQVSKIDGFEQHDEEMDDLAEMAIKSHKDLLDIGMNAEIRHAGEIFGVSAQMLKIAVDAKNLKVEKKLRLLRLQLDKMRIDKMHSNNDADVIEGSARRLDRNELIKMLKNSDETTK